MTIAEYESGEQSVSFDGNGEPLCSLPSAPASCLAAALTDIARTAGQHLAREYSTELPPANPPTV